MDTAKNTEGKTGPLLRNSSRVSGLLLMASAAFFFSFTVT